MSLHVLDEAPSGDCSHLNLARLDERIAADDRSTIVKHDCTTVTLSVSESKSSSGSTSTNSWRTLRPSTPQMDDAALNVDVVDTGQPRCQRSPVVAPTELMKKMVEVGQAPGVKGGASMLLAALENGQVNY